MPRTVRSDPQQLLQELLKEARQAAGLTQEQLGRLIKRPQPFIAKYERGERRLDVVEFLVIAKAMKADAAQIIAKVSRQGLPSRI